MKKLYGHVFNKEGQPVSGADVEVKNIRFETVYHAISGEDGSYCVEVPEAVYPFITCVKEYGVNYIEYWCQNADLNRDLELNPSFDTLEVYGVHPFRVRGAYDAYMVYFRPMELTRFQQGLPDICPELDRIEVTVNGSEAPVMLVNTVREGFVDAQGRENQMTAVLMQVKNPLPRIPLEKMELKVWDKEGHMGMALYYPEKE